MQPASRKVRGLFIRLSLSPAGQLSDNPREFLNRAMDVAEGFRQICSFRRAVEAHLLMHDVRAVMQGDQMGFDVFQTIH